MEILDSSEPSSGASVPYFGCYAPMYIFKIVAIVLFAFGSAANAVGCKTLSDQLMHDEPIVKTKLLALKPKQLFSGITLCDGTKVFAGWRFLRSVPSKKSSQHIFVFRQGRSTRAIIWVDPSGDPIAIPACPLGARCGDLPEAATIISGDIYTHQSALPGKEIVIVQHPLSVW